MEIMRADYYTLLRVPGIGVKSAKKNYISKDVITMLDFEQFERRWALYLKRAAYFITCNGKDYVSS
ncbi:MAG: hypothetical protein ACLUR5_10050 [Eubacterium ventriosum]